MRCAIVIVLSLAVVNSLAAQAGDSTRGQALLGNQGCLSCHSVGGVGGREAPDLRPADRAGLFSRGVRRFGLEPCAGDVGIHGSAEPG